MDELLLKRSDVGTKYSFVNDDAYKPRSEVAKPIIQSQGNIEAFALLQRYMSTGHVYCEYGRALSQAISDPKVRNQTTRFTRKKCEDPLF